MACNGKSKIPYYVLLTRAFGIPAFVLFDRDGEGEESADNAKILAFCEGLPVHMFKDSFEQLLGIGKNVEHKASKVLLRIDEIVDGRLDVPEEIKNAIESTAHWLSDGTPAQSGRAAGRTGESL